MGDDLFAHNPESKIWLDRIIVYVRAMKKMELHRFLLEYRRSNNIDRWPSTAEEFAQELEHREFSDIFWESLAAEEYLKKDFRPADTSVLREAGLGPVGYGAEDLEAQRYAMLYRDVDFFFTPQGENERGEEEWRISIYFRGQFVRYVIDDVYLSSTE